MTKSRIVDNAMTDNEGITVCGLVMPISKTSNHETLHWLRVQQLLHRAIKQAGLAPQNVWEGSSVDRITPRILGKLFSVPILVCDISDLNPNVMLELGMRLTSKKPTVVVAESGATIPFDIKDFQALFYPRDLNILDMELFFDELRESLQEKLSSFNNGTYHPFLKDVEIDFLDVSGKAVPFETLVEKRLDAISSRLEALSLKPKAQNISPIKLSDVGKVSTNQAGALIKFDAGSYNSAQVNEAILKHSMLFGSAIADGVVLVPFGKPASATVISNIKAALEKMEIIASVESIADF